MEIKDLLQKLIYVLDGLAILIIIWGTLIQFFNFLKEGIFIHKDTNVAQFINTIKNKLGAYILFGLEILIGADIIESIIDPSIEHIITLAVIVIIRTIISFFLTRELSDTSN